MIWRACVWEWCLDWYAADYYAKAPKADPVNSDSGDKTYRVCRGGSWGFYPTHCRSANRGGGTPAGRFYSYGFRVVLAYPWTILDYDSNILKGGNDVQIHRIMGRYHCNIESINAGIGCLQRSGGQQSRLSLRKKHLLKNCRVGLAPP